jgi:hypothetical protein
MRPQASVSDPRGKKTASVVNPCDLIDDLTTSFERAWGGSDNLSVLWAEAKLKHTCEMAGSFKVDITEGKQLFYRRKNVRKT